MRRAFKWLVVALVVVLLGAGAFGAWYVFGEHAPGQPELSATASGATTGGPSTPNGAWHVVRGAEVFVGYRIAELFGDTTIKRDAVGRTSAVGGRLTIEDNRVTQAVVTADARQLSSERDARDAYVRDDALQTDEFPTARLTLTAPIALRAPVTKGKTQPVEARGMLLLHGVQHPVTITLDARWDGPTIQAVGTAPIVLSDYGITPPHTVIADVDDHGSLELSLTFRPGRDGAPGAH